MLANQNHQATVTTAPDQAAVTPAQIREILQTVADAKSKTYNCSVSIAFKSADVEASAAGGIVDFSSGRKASVDDVYAWGSGFDGRAGEGWLLVLS